MASPEPTRRSLKPAVCAMTLSGACLAAPLAARADVEVRNDPASDCESCAEWNRPIEPFQIFGNTWYVGTAELSSILIASNRGHILLDGALPQSAERIARNIQSLGFAVEDVRLIVNSHAHFDHAGGIAALQRATGATVAASLAGAQALENGGPLEDDPQFLIPPEEKDFPPATDVRAVQDGETLRVGLLEITANYTPGHTPGSTSWTWRSCEGETCVNMVYADSLTAVSADGYRFTDRDGVVDAFRYSIARVWSLPCDILITPHPGVIRMQEKLSARAENPEPNPFIDDLACKAYASAAAQRLEDRIRQERETPPAVRASAD